MALNHTHLIDSLLGPQAGAIAVLANASHAELPQLGREPSAKALEAYIDIYLSTRAKPAGNPHAPIFKVELPDNTIVTLAVGMELSRTYLATGWVSCRHQAGSADNANASFLWMS